MFSAWNAKKTKLINVSNDFHEFFKKKTIVEKNEYLTYRRRNDDRIWIVRFFNENQFVMNNHWIISYNSYFIRRYQIYINVKFCVIVKIIKYIHKYIYKNDDQITLQINKNDEIFQHINDRYIYSVQVVWKLMKYFIHFEFFVFHRLFLHLSDKQFVYFSANLSSQQLRNRMKIVKFEFIKFLKYNRFHANEKNILYQNWFEKYVWKISFKRWKFRKKNFVIDWIYHCNIIAKNFFFCECY